MALYMDLMMTLLWDIVCLRCKKEAQPGTRYFQYLKVCMPVLLGHTRPPVLVSMQCPHVAVATTLLELFGISHWFFLCFQTNFCECTFYALKSCSAIWTNSFTRFYVSRTPLRKLDQWIVQRMIYKNSSTQWNMIFYWIAVKNQLMTRNHPYLSHYSAVSSPGPF